MRKKKNEVWHYCTEDWSCLRCQEVDREHRHQDRAALHPWWIEVINLDLNLTCEPLKREYPRACKDISTLMDLVGGCILSVGTILDCKSKDLAGVTEYGQKLIASKLRQMWDNKEKDGRREFERKMNKRWSEIWPFGYEARPE